MSTAETIKKIIADQAMIPVEDVRDDASPDDLGLDSLAVVEIVFSIEEAFDVSVPFNANEPDKSDFDISTVAKIIAAVEELIRAKA
ncbi:MAG: phosphopantetheine-binding protein [Pseudomonadota bacterium]